MPRGNPPDQREPGAFAGLTQRRRERGLPVGDQARCTCPLPYGPADDCPFHREHPFWRRPDDPSQIDALRRRAS